MGKGAKVHFLTAYIEYLLDQGIRTEEAYLGDASRFLRYLIGKATQRDVAGFVTTQTSSVQYAKRLRKHLRKFYRFANDWLEIPNNPLQDAAD